MKKIYRDVEIPKYKLEPTLWIDKTNNYFVNDLNNLYKHHCKVHECNDGVVSKIYIEKNVQRTFVF